MLLQYHSTVPELLHCLKTEIRVYGPVRWKPTYYISLETSRRGEYNEVKNMQNGWALWEKTKGEVSDPKMKSSNPCHHWSNWHFKHLLHCHKRLFWVLGWISKASNWWDHELANRVKNQVGQSLYQSILLIE
jgi:hypothetical protein